MLGYTLLFEALVYRMLWYDAEYTAEYIGKGKNIK